jgi:ABC-type polysaccharide/polyol phosphate transport system ATPase subunit
MSGAEVDLTLAEVSKAYRKSPKRGADTFWALKDISFEVPRGRALGVIGRNGAGKSTLLKLLAGITAPTRGRIVLHGSVAALIEVGSGFHPELTGRENVFLSGAILGMKRREIAAKLESIVEFAGVGRFIDTPVKWYSSGMYVRLGFAVAAHLEADILLVDEVLAVGDAEFQVKCLQRIQELRDRGVTSLFISHDLTAVERLCDSAILLEAGQLAAAGAPADVVATYHRRLALWNPASGQSTIDSPESGIALTNISLRTPDETRAVAFQTGAPLTISVRYAAARTIPNLEFEARYYSRDGKTRIAAPKTGESRQGLEVKPPGGVIEFHCPALPLNRGSYVIGAVVRDLATGTILAWWDGDTRLYVSRGPVTDAQLYIPHSWRLIHDDEQAAVVTPGAPPSA